MNSRNIFLSARFLVSVFSLKDLPADTGLEIAFCGRSNSGKSSVLNAITRNKKLAKTSKTPGRTQTLNVFCIDEFCQKDPDATLSDFLEEVSLLSDIDHWNDSDNRVTLMPVHSSKGLEFPGVFVAGLDDGLFPLYNALETKEGLEEERRLFYVALTRAQERVFLLYATKPSRQSTYIRAYST